MDKEFIPYEQALELKELGFNENCLAFYNFGERLMPIDTDFTNFRELSDDLTKAPLYQQAFRWFREKYGMLYTIEENLEDDQVWYEWDVKSSNGFEGSFEATYEEAELACLKKLIEIVKNK